MWLKDQSKEKIGWISSYGWWLPPKACSQSKYSAVRFKVSTWVLKFLNIQQQELTAFKQPKLIKSKNLNQTGELMGLLRQISSSLLLFREQVGGEIMRIVMLPEQSLNLKLPNSDCDYCQVIERQISFFHKYFHNCIVSLFCGNSANILLKCLIDNTFLAIVWNVIALEVKKVVLLFLLLRNCKLK